MTAERQSPLRAVGRETKVLSVAALMRALQDPSDRLSPEEQREAELVAFVIWGERRAQAQARGESVEDGPVEASAERLARTTGVGEKAVRTALERLKRSGVLEEEDGETRLTPLALRTEPMALDVQWPWVFRQVEGKTTPLLSTWALAQRINPPDEWAPVEFDSIGKVTRTSLRTIGRAMEVLESRGVVGREHRPGKADLYRFTERALGRAASLKQDDGTVREPTSRRIPPASSVSAEAPEGTRGTTRVMEVGGLQIKVPMGTEVTMEIGPNGEVYCRLAPRWRIRVD